MWMCLIIECDSRAWVSLLPIQNRQEFFPLLLVFQILIPSSLSFFHRSICDQVHSSSLFLSLLFVCVFLSFTEASLTSKNFEDSLHSSSTQKFSPLRLALSLQFFHEKFLPLMIKTMFSFRSYLTLDYLWYNSVAKVICEEKEVKNFGTNQEDKIFLFWNFFLQKKCTATVLVRNVRGISCYNFVIFTHVIYST